MRNFKKLLALVLALVMSLSLVAVANAADYTDVADDDDHIGAIDVMSGLGIINGYPDGSFKPEGTLTRAEGAKIVTYMLLGNAADKLPKDVSSFSDVPTGKWFAAPIAYLKNEGIVNGRSATVFAPNDTLTGYEFAKMVLVAAGVEGEFTGSAWKLNVASALSKNDLLDNVDPSSAPISRAEAAQLGLNGLNYTAEEETDKEVYTIKSKDTTGAKDLAAVDGASYDTYKEAAENATQANTDSKGSSTLGTNYEIVREKVSVKTDSLGDKVFGLAVKTGEADKFMRPSSSYTTTKKGYDVKLTIPGGADYTIEGPISEKDLYAMVGSAVASASAKDKYAWAEYVDGEKNGPSTNPDKSKTTNYGKTDNGTVTEIYVDDDAKTVTVIVVNTYISTIAKVNPADAGDKRNVTLKDEAATVTYETEDFAKGDVVLYTKSTPSATAEIQSMELAKSVTGTLSKMVTKGTTVTYTVDGKEYVKSAKGKTELTNNNLNKTVSFYVDAQGNIMKDIDAAAAANAYIYVVANADAKKSTDYVTGSGNDYTVEVYGVTVDGKAATYTAESSENVKANTLTGLYTYTTDSDTGNLELTAVTTTAYNGEIKANATSAAGATLNSSTVFVFVKTKGADNKTVENVTVKTGNANIGDTIGAGKAYVGAKDGVAEVVFVAAGYSDAAQDSGNLVYVDNTKKETETAHENGKVTTTYKYTAVDVDGNELTVTGKENTATGIYTYNSDMSLSDSAADHTGGAVLVGAIEGSTIKLGTSRFNTNSDTKEVFLGDEQQDLAVGQNVWYATDSKDSTVTAIWVITDAPAAVTLTGGTQDTETVAVTGETEMVIGATVENKTTVTVTTTKADYDANKMYEITFTFEDSGPTAAPVRVKGTGTKTLTADVIITGVSKAVTIKAKVTEVSATPVVALNAGSTKAEVAKSGGKAKVTIVTDGADFMADSSGTYKLYVGDSTEGVSAKTHSSADKTLEFENVDGLTKGVAATLRLTCTESSKAESEAAVIELTAAQVTEAAE